MTDEQPTPDTPADVSGVPPAEEHYHEHSHYHEAPAPPRAAAAVREPPANPDPLADYDALWRKQPAVLGFMHFARYIPGFAAQFATAVPQEFWGAPDRQQAEIDCPCGVALACQRNGIVECECHRVYAYAAGQVYVGYTEELARTLET